MELAQKQQDDRKTHVERMA